VPLLVTVPLGTPLTKYNRAHWVHWEAQEALIFERLTDAPWAILSRFYALLAYSLDVPQRRHRAQKEN
jgi:hypothetical protein